MESEEARAQLREIERGEAASWLHFAGQEWWLPLAFGTWAGALVLTLGVLDDAQRRFPALVLIAAPLVYLAWDRNRRSVYPQGPMPREIRRSTWALVVLSPGLALLSTWVFFAAGPWVAAAVAAVATAAGLELYGRLYASDAERVRRRLA